MQSILVDDVVLIHIVFILIVTTQLTESLIKGADGFVGIYRYIRMEPATEKQIDQLQDRKIGLYKLTF